jgi:carbamoyltransferase
MVTAEGAARFFDIARPDPFMLTVWPVKPAWRERLPSITHVDGTARVQVVDRDAGALHALLEAFERLRGVPILINTSFNVKGEPIVNTPADALRCLVTTGLDALAIGSFVVSKRGA